MSSDNLNDEQQKIIQSPAKQIIIKAGPGTGKTKTLINRITYLLNDLKTNPQDILVLTFTERAASEIKERLESLDADFKCLPFITTFHGFAHALLKNNRQNIQLISEEERHRLIRNIIRQKNVKLSTRKLSLLISLAKNTAQETELTHELKLLLGSYNQELQRLSLQDFDDLLINLYLFLRGQSTARTTKYSHILIDEFQDTNDLQYQIIKLLLSPTTYLFAIGDPLQSIYGFRGANPQIFQQLEKDFPKNFEAVLFRNYRSFTNLVQISNQLFPGLAQGVANSAAEGKVRLVKTYDESSEANWIINFINEKIGGSDLLQARDATSCQPIKFSDFAIIYRTHNLNRALEKKLTLSGLPFQTVGGYSLYEEKHISLLCSLLQFLAEGGGQSLPFFPKLSSTKLKQTAKLLTSQPLSQLVNSLLGIWQLPQPDNSINQFLGNIIQFDQYPDSLNRFINYYKNLKAYDYYDAQSDKITLLTMHAAKGLEFKHVFICGFEENIIPFKRCGEEVADPEEEKRLLYVAMTRAKEELYLLSAKFRQGREGHLSPFAKDLEHPEFLTIEDNSTEKILKKKAALKLKKSQLSLF